mmetsp:Transcript_78764/g.218931  ORF Transcript_78764/g.218931 Transcript_78764/m.218931 type:complete len:345 (-) Transcript_78764:503-1537(-)
MDPRSVHHALRVVFAAISERLHLALSAVDHVGHLGFRLRLQVHSHPPIEGVLDEAAIRSTCHVRQELLGVLLLFLHELVHGPLGLLHRVLHLLVLSVLDKELRPGLEAERLQGHVVVAVHPRDHLLRVFRLGRLHALDLRVQFVDLARIVSDIPVVLDNFLPELECIIFHIVLLALALLLHHAAHAPRLLSLELDQLARGRFDLLLKLLADLVFRPHRFGVVRPTFKDRHPYRFGVRADKCHEKPFGLFALRLQEGSQLLLRRRELPLRIHRVLLTPDQFRHLRICVVAPGLVLLLQRRDLGASLDDGHPQDVWEDACAGCVSEDRLHLLGVSILQGHPYSGGR